MSLTRATGALLADKVVDIGTLLALCAITGLLGLAIGGRRMVVAAHWVVLGAAGALLLFVATFRHSPLRWLAARVAGLRDLAGGLSALRDPTRCSASVAFSIAARLTEVLALRVLCGAMGFPLSLQQVFLALVIVNLSVSVPVSLANLGVYEAGLAYGLRRSGVPLPAAAVLATTHHMLELFGITISAAGYALALQLTRRTAVSGVRAP